MWVPENEKSNLFSGFPTSLPEEVSELLAGNQNVRIERIVSHGQASPEDFWYDQDEHEWVVVLQGEAKLVFEQEAEPLHLTCGDHILIPAGCKHRVHWTTPSQPTVWLAVFYRADQ